MIYSSKNLETACGTTSYSHWVFQDEDIRMLECQYGDIFIFILMKTKHAVHIMVFGAACSDGKVMSLFIFPHDFTLNKYWRKKCNPGIRG